MEKSAEALHNAHNTYAGAVLEAIVIQEEQQGGGGLVQRLLTKLPRAPQQQPWQVGCLKVTGWATGHRQERKCMNRTAHN